MDDPVKYQKHNHVQRFNNHKCLVENIEKINWNGNDRVLDIGSGDGSFTANTLKGFLPPGFEELIGIDKNERMVKFANEHYAADKIKFEMLEIGVDLPKRYMRYFHHVFSFYALMFVQDQRKAFSQIYDLLQEDGDCLLNAVGHAPFAYDSWRILAKTDKWSPWIKTEYIETIVSPYHDCLDPVKKVTDIMSEVGFKDIDVQYNKLPFLDNTDELKSFFRDVSIVNVPEQLFEEYFADFVKVARDNGYIDQNGKTHQSLLVIYGKK